MHGITNYKAVIPRDDAWISYILSISLNKITRLHSSSLNLGVMYLLISDYHHDSS